MTSRQFAAARFLRAVVQAAAVLAVGCSGDPARTDVPTAGASPLEGLILSNPTALPPATTGAALAPIVESVVYASLPPGSLPDAELVQFTNPATGAGATAVVVNGGFDPVPVPASVGDSIEVRVQLRDGRGDRVFYAKVPPRRPPVIVRSDPPPGRRDVPLNSRLTVVFSEPLAALPPDTAVQLLRGTTRIPGTLTFADRERLAIVLTPAAPLEPATDYRLLLAAGIMDGDGDEPQLPVTIPFSTAPNSGGPTTDGRAVLLVQVSTSGITLDSAFKVVACRQDEPSPCVEIPLRSGVTRLQPSPGTYRYRLIDVATNCTVTSPDVADVTIEAGRWAQITFAVRCGVTWNVRFVVTFSGVDLPGNRAYICVDMMCSGDYMVEVASPQISIPVSSGTHVASVQAFPSNCAGPGLVNFTVSPETSPTSVIFPYTCIALGTLRVGATFSGAGVDNLLQVVDMDSCWEDCATHDIVAGAPVEIRVPAGERTLELRGIDPGCELSRPAVQTYQVISGQTTEVRFDLRCP